MGGAAIGESRSHTRTGCWGADRSEEPTQKAAHALTNPVTLPSTSQQSRTPLASDCLCLEALIAVPCARPLSSNNRFCSSGEPRAAPNCPSVCGQHTLPHSSLSICSPTGALCPEPNTLLGGDGEGTAKCLRKGRMKA